MIDDMVVSIMVTHMAEKKMFDGAKHNNTEDANATFSSLSTATLSLTKR